MHFVLYLALDLVFFLLSEDFVKIWMSLECELQFCNWLVLSLNFDSGKELRFFSYKFELFLAKEKGEVLVLV